MKNNLIYETENFIVEAFDKPHVDREEGGHIKIFPKVRILDRQQLTPKQAIEFIRLTMVVGEAMAIAMNKRGVDIGRINYQDNGNWTVFSPDGPYFHMHLYGRAKSAKVNKYGNAIIACHREENPEHYAKMKPLNEDDIKEIRKQIEIIFKKYKYKDTNWRL